MSPGRLSGTAIASEGLQGGCHPPIIWTLGSGLARAWSPGNPGATAEEMAFPCAGPEQPGGDQGGSLQRGRRLASRPRSLCPGAQNPPRALASAAPAGSSVGLRRHEGSWARHQGLALCAVGAALLRSPLVLVPDLLWLFPLPGRGLSLAAPCSRRRVPRAWEKVGCCHAAHGSKPAVLSIVLLLASPCRAGLRAL